MPADQERGPVSQHQVTGAGEQEELDVQHALNTAGSEGAAGEQAVLPKGAGQGLGWGESCIPQCRASCPHLHPSPPPSRDMLQIAAPGRAVCQ